jgi:4-hydroxybenzoate polyprenyltransferase
MEWSLTQNKLLAYHRLMRTDKPIGALLLLWPTLWALARHAGRAAAVDPGRVRCRRLADARGGLRGE